MLQILVIAWCAAHYERHNKYKLMCDLKVRAVVKSHVHVNSVANMGIISKLSNMAQYPLMVTAD